MADAHIKAKATGLDPTNNQITLDNGETLTYTDLVIATGSNCPFPAKLPSDTSNSKQDVLKQYKEIHMEVIFCNLVWCSYKLSCLYIKCPL